MPRQLKPTAIHPKFVLITCGFCVFVGIGITLAWWMMGVKITHMFEGIPHDQETQSLYDHLFRLPFVSLLTGTLIGLPANLWLKRHLKVRRHEVLCDMLQPRPIKRSWPLIARQLKRGLLEILPLAASILIAAGTAYWLGIALQPAKAGPCMTMFLWYPEYKSIYEEARRQLAAN